MAKYDSYVLTSKLTGAKGEVTLTTSVLFEVGDVVSTVIADVRTKNQAEIIALKASGYMDNFK